MKSKEESKLTDQLEEMLSRIGELLDKYEECKFFLLENLFVSKNKLTVSSRIPKKEIELQKYREQKEKVRINILLILSQLKSLHF